MRSFDLTSFNRKVIDLTSFDIKLIDLTSFDTKLIDLTSFDIKLIDLTTFHKKLIDLTKFRHFDDYKGPSIKDFRRKSGFLDPPFPVCPGLTIESV